VRGLHGQPVHMRAAQRGPLGFAAVRVLKEATRTEPLSILARSIGRQDKQSSTMKLCRTKDACREIDNGRPVRARAEALLRESFRTGPIGIEPVGVRDRSRNLAIGERPRRSAAPDRWATEQAARKRRSGCRSRATLGRSRVSPVQLGDGSSSGGVPLAWQSTSGCQARTPTARRQPGTGRAVDLAAFGPHCAGADTNRMRPQYPWWLEGPLCGDRRGTVRRFRSNNSRTRMRRRRRARSWEE